MKQETKQQMLAFAIIDEVKKQLSEKMNVLKWQLQQFWQEGIYC